MTNVINNVNTVMHYEKLGFRCGLEIHQQVDAGKLFCRCPSIVHDENTNMMQITRRLRPVAGEQGEIDAAALYEATKGKKMVYEFCDTSSCLVEIDEEPPHEVNNDALRIALQVAKMVNARVVDSVLVMRKIVIDGSNVSGFQRTALIAENGRLQTSKGVVMIDTICLEEEAAQKVKTTDDAIVYRLDRLGVGLIEIATDASIKDPEHAKEVAEKLGMILRSTGKVKRGIGSIRQDVNVSIEGCPRVEIKGFQELRTIPKVIEFEISRQLKLLEAQKGNDIKEEINKQDCNKGNLRSEVRKAEPDGSTSFLRPMPGADRMYPETDVPSVRITKEFLKSIELPKLIEDSIDEAVEKYKLDKDLIATLLKEKKVALFSELVSSCPSLTPGYIADLLLSGQKQVEKQCNKKSCPTEEDFKIVLTAVHQKIIPKEVVIELLSQCPVSQESLKRFEMLDDEQLKKQIEAIINVNIGIPPNALVGKVMAVLRGKADGKKIVEMVQRLQHP